ncbi:MAG: ribosome small subunit-dependent GTPase A [Faecalimonas umbilicata]|uniref:ribosome small subunit-dependent GTPase A n=1 Tax=Faecalimonas umbilicata TaxID=1912855 RepID=UPI00300F53DF
MTGKIIKGIAGFYYVHDGSPRCTNVRQRAYSATERSKPLVGDNVEFTVLDEKEQTGNIDDILPRKNELIRPAVANIDQAMMVFAMTDPEPNLNLLDRFLVMMECQQCRWSSALIRWTWEPVTGSGSTWGISMRPPGTQSIFISTNDKEGVDMVRELLKGKTTVLAGPSGVGKSSLTNQHPAGGCHGDRGHQRKDRAGASIPPAIPSCFLWRGHLHDGYAGFQLHVCGVWSRRS